MKRDKIAIILIGLFLLTPVSSMISMNFNPVTAEADEDYDDRVPDPREYESVDYGGCQYHLFKDGTAELFYGYNDDEEITVPSIITKDNKEYNVYNIGPKAFDGTSEDRKLKSITINEGVRKIDHWAFKDCKNLTTVKFPESLTQIRSCAFWNCALSTISLPKNIKKIYDEVFYNCPFISVELPEGITSIGYGAFDNSKITSLKIPASAENVNFQNIGTDNIEIDPNNMYYTKVNDIIYNKEMTVIERALKNISGIFDIPDTVKLIDDWCFWGCDKLEGVEIPQSVEEIGDNAFEMCTSLKSLTIPQSVNKISKSIFNNCSNLRTLTIYCNDTCIYNQSYYKLNCDNIRFINPDDIDIRISDEYNIVDLKGLDYSERQYVKKGSNLIYDSDKYDLYRDNNEVKDTTINENCSFDLIEKPINLDFNNDGVFDTLDLTEIAKSYNKTCKSDGWNPKVDLVKDDICDIYDIVKASSYLK